MYVVASFIREGGSIHVVPSNWLLSNDKTKWPIGLSGVEVKRMIMKQEEIPQKWSAHDIKIYCYKDSFELAEVAADKYCVTSNPSSHGEMTSNEIEIIQPTHSRQQKFLKKKRIQDIRHKNENDSSESDPDDDFPVCSLVKDDNNGSMKTPVITTAIPANDIFAEKVFRLLVGLKKRMKKLEDKVDKLQGCSSPSADPVVIHQKDTSYNFPLSEIESLDDLERDLALQENNQKLCLHLSTKPSVSWKNMVLVLMKYVISRKLALEYNMNGQRGKRKFSDLRLSNVIIAAVKMAHPDTSTGDILKRMSCVLAGARDWDGERKKRIRAD